MSRGVAVRALGAVALAGIVAGCAGSITVDPELVEVFPEEGRRWMYEAENEVIIALDRRDAARDALEALLDKRQTTPPSPKAPALYDARISWLDASIDHAEAEIHAAEIAVRCAKRGLELTKARLAVRFDLPVAEGYVTPFQDVYLSCATDLADAREDAGHLSVLMKEARQFWRQTRSAHAKQTGDYNHGLWIH